MQCLPGSGGQHQFAACREGSYGIQPSKSSLGNPTVTQLAIALSVKGSSSCCRLLPVNLIRFSLKISRTFLVCQYNIFGLHRLLTCTCRLPSLTVRNAGSQNVYCGSNDMRVRFVDECCSMHDLKRDFSYVALLSSTEKFGKDVMVCFSSSHRPRSRELCSASVWDVTIAGTLLPCSCPCLPRSRSYYIQAQDPLLSNDCCMTCLFRLQPTT